MQTYTITVKSDPDQDDCLESAAEFYAATFPDAAGYELNPRWADAERVMIELDVPAGSHLWRVGAYIPRDGQYLGCDQAEVLGPEYGVAYLEKTDAQQAAEQCQDDLSDYDLDPDIVYCAERASS